MEHIQTLQALIDHAAHICVFTGAGISCPSGIPDFRSADGLYSETKGSVPPEEIISHSFFLQNPELFYRFYTEKMVYPDALPNPAHRYFASLEQRGKRVSVVTQNIDGLHQKAGSSEVYELHGSVERNFCTVCRKPYPLSAVTDCHGGAPRCPDDGGIIKPDVVLYEEPLDNATVQGAVDAIATADLMIVIGTSLVVYPAASFLQYYTGRDLVLINKDATLRDSMASLVFHTDVIEVVNKLK